MTLAPEGSLSGTSFQPGTFQFYVEMREPGDDPAHCAGKRTQKQFTLKIRQQPWIVSSSDTAVSEVGRPFRMPLRARGGSGIFAWSLASGRLPAGLRLFADGSIAGTPRSHGVYRFTVRASDSEGRTIGRTAELAIVARLRVQTRRLPAARAGRTYRADLTATGGVAPTVWKVTGGRLPHGLRLESAQGRLTGSPTEPGTHSFTVEVRDGLRATGTGRFRLVVAKPHGD